MAAETTAPATIEVDLKNQGLAAFLAWLWPGAGHLYQGRYGKSVLFMVCILGTYFFGLTLGDGHVVYASWKQEDRRWQYPLCQVWVGLPALPAIVQTLRVNSGREPLFNGRMAPPRTTVHGEHELASWHRELGSKFELGTLYTVIAGLLNVLVIYDAFGGPFTPLPDLQRSGDATRNLDRRKTKQKSMT